MFYISNTFDALYQHIVKLCRHKTVAWLRCRMASEQIAVKGWLLNSYCASGFVRNIGFFFNPDLLKYQHCCEPTAYICTYGRTARIIPFSSTLDTHDFNKTTISFVDSNLGLGLQHICFARKASNCICKRCFLGVKSLAKNLELICEHCDCTFFVAHLESAEAASAFLGTVKRNTLKCTMCGGVYTPSVFSTLRTFFDVIPNLYLSRQVGIISNDPLLGLMRFVPADSWFLDRLRCYQIQ